MNIKEYEFIKDFNYYFYCEYLREKYKDIDINDYSKNGLFKHHFYENKIPNIPNQPDNVLNEYINDYKLIKDFEDIDLSKIKSDVIPADYLEHLYLHILIAELEPFKGLGIGGATAHIIPEIEAYLNDGTCKYKNNEFYTKIDKEAFLKLKDRAFKFKDNLSGALEHNKILIKSLIDMLNEKDRALVVLGTGLGKTSTALEYIRQTCSDKRALVLVPNNTIRSGWEKYPSLVEVDTIQSFSKNKKYEEYDYSKYSLLIVDEAHHSEADMWGAAVKYVLDNRKLKVLGLTATPDRTDGKDLRETIFKDCVCEGYAIDDAIEKRLIHPFSYISAIYMSDDEIRKEAGECSNTELVGRLDIAIQKKKNVNEILHKYMPSGNRKCIVYIDDTSEDAISKYEEIIKSAYPDAESRKLLSSMDSKEQIATREWFADKNTKNAYLLCYNMMNEGAHYEGVNTIIMFRKTSSWLVFLQQIGRIVTLSKNPDPKAIVFDFVNNIDTVSYDNNSVGSYSQEHGNKIIVKLKECKSDSIIIGDESRDIVEAIRAIKKFEDDTWEDWEIEILKKYYIKEGAEGCQKRIDEEWECRYPGRLTI